MRVAVAGATGVLGRAVLPLLRDAGHEIRGFARSAPAGSDELVSIDLLDREAVVAFAREWRPEAIVHIATAIPVDLDTRRAVEQFEPTNRLRTEGTGNLVAAAEAAGGARLISQSIAFITRPGPGPAGEDAPVRDEPGDVMAPIVAAVLELERLTVDAGGTVLRFGQFYGPGTTFTPDGGLGAMIVARRMPVLTRRGGASSVTSFIHVDDAATAVAAALASHSSGVFNVVDDDPAPVTEWLPLLASALGAPPPRRLPAWIARPVAGAYGVAFMTELRGASNAKAKAELGWKPSIPSWREGFSRV